MDVLMPALRRRWLPWLVLSVWLTVSACLSLRGAVREEPSFPHRVHVVDNKLDCSFCHVGSTSTDRPGMPPPELCAPCHDRFDPEKPPERRVAAFFEETSVSHTVSTSPTRSCNARPATATSANRTRCRSNRWSGRRHA
jgi:hypothetical protein